VLDSLAVWPLSLVVIHKRDTLQADSYFFDAMRSALFLRTLPKGDSIRVAYSTVPWKAGFVFRKKELALVTTETTSNFKPFVLGSDSELSFFQDRVFKRTDLFRGAFFSGTIRTSP
jgi:hypothetical protein